MSHEQDQRPQPASSADRHRFSRRSLLHAAGVGGLGVLVAPSLTSAAALRSRPSMARSQGEGTPVGMVDQLVIDLGVEPPTLDPALVYSPNAWSVVHSVYDSLLQYGPNGEIEFLLAESMRLVDPLTYEITLRPNVAFHNGEPFDANSVVLSVAHLLDPNVASQARQNFEVISEVRVLDPLTVQFVLSTPAPWLPAPIAAWLAMLPPSYAADPANGFDRNPIGTGPYRFVEWQPGGEIVLDANPDYFAASPKGRPFASRVVYRVVQEGATQVADLLSDRADLITEVGVDQVAPIGDAGKQVVTQAVPGAAFVRIATDVEPFTDVRVRQALNHAVDVDAIIGALLGGEGRRMANLFPEGGLGYDPNLPPYAYDPDKARALLAEAGFADGFETTLEYESTEPADVVTAIAAQLDAVGIRVEVQATEEATFNAPDRWKGPQAPPLRFLTWRPIFEPYTVLSLLISDTGFLSRYRSAQAQPLIDAGAVATDPAQRAAIYRDLGTVLRDDPAAIYLYSLTARYGVGAKAAVWRSRPDEYVIATERS